MARRLILVRHGEVAVRWRGVCYGQSDVELSERGLLQSEEVADHLASLPIDCVWHSGLARTRILAELLARRKGVRCVAETALRERNFGAWEGRTWDDIYARTGAAMDGMVLAPDTFRPPEGETTFELRDRVLSWYGLLPADGLFVAITHGGPIASLLGGLAGDLATDWPRLIPACGTGVELLLGVEGMGVVPWVPDCP